MMHEKTTINSFFSKSYIKLLYIIILNLVVFFAFQLLNPIHYDISDDMYISMFIQSGDWYFGFVDYFFCAICGMIQKLIFPLNAYTLVIELLCLISMITITWVIVKKYGYIFGTIITLVFNAFFAVNYYSNVSFTKSPAIISLAGLLVIIHSCKERLWGIKLTYGGLLIIIGSTIRFKIFEVAVVFAAVFILAATINDYLDVEKANRKAADFFRLLFEKRRAICLALVILASFALQFASESIINGVEVQKYYREYTVARSAVWDYPIPSYSDCPEKYDAIGIDENDLKMLEYGYMDDEGAFTLENLKAIKSLANKYINAERSLGRVVFQSAKSAVNNLRNYNEEGLAYTALFLCILFYILIAKRRRLLIPSFLSATAIAFFVYLHYIERFPYRATHVIWVSASLFLIYALPVKDLKSKLSCVKNKRTIESVAVISLALLLCVVTVFSIKLNTHYISYINSEVDNQRQLKEFIFNEKNKDNKYELPLRMGGLTEVNNNVIYSIPLDSKKCLQFFITYYKSTCFYRMTEEFGTDNMYANLFNENIYFVDKNDNNTQVNMMQKYLEKYYSDGQTVNCSLIQNCGDYSVYKFSMR